MPQITIDHTTYDFNDQGYILRQETVFNSGYKEIKTFCLAEVPESPGNYFVKEEKLVSTDKLGMNSYMHKTTVITSGNRYAVFVEEFSDWGRHSRDIFHYASQPPLASRIPEEYLEKP